MNLKEAIEIMKAIKNNDVNGELEIFVENHRFIIQEKIIKLKGGGIVCYR